MKREALLLYLGERGDNSLQFSALVHLSRGNRTLISQTTCLSLSGILKRNQLISLNFSTLQLLLYSRSPRVPPNCRLTLATALSWGTPRRGYGFRQPAGIKNGRMVMRPYIAPVD